MGGVVPVIIEDNARSLCTHAVYVIRILVLPPLFGLGLCDQVLRKLYAPHVHVDKLKSYDHSEVHCPLSLVSRLVGMQACAHEYTHTDRHQCLPSQPHMHTHSQPQEKQRRCEGRQRQLQVNHGSLLGFVHKLTFVAYCNQHSGPACQGC